MLLLVMPQALLSEKRTVDLFAWPRALALREERLTARDRACHHAQVLLLLVHPVALAAWMAATERWRATSHRMIVSWVAAFLRALDLKDVEVEASEFAFDLGERALLVGERARLLLETVDGALNLLRCVAQVGADSAGLIVGGSEGLVAGDAVLAVGVVARLYVADELLYWHVAEVGVRVEHNQILDHLVEGFFFALQK